MLTTAFALVLARWCREPAMTLNLTTFNRMPLHPDIDQLIGDFTALSLLAVNVNSNSSLTEQVRQVQQQLFQDLSHRAFSGVEVLRLINQDRDQQQAIQMPVVFTSTLGVMQQTEALLEQHCLGVPVYSISQTPQVWLDHQVMEQNGALVSNWDAVEQLFDPEQLDAMFASWQTLFGTTCNG